MARATVYRTKIDWWVPVIVVSTMALALIGPMIDGDGFILGIMMSAMLGALEILIFASVKYQICDGKLGIRNLFYRWDWFPVDKISEIRNAYGILSAPALSSRRIAIVFSDKMIMKSSTPLEISPTDRDAFVEQLKQINPDIVIDE